MTNTKPPLEAEMAAEKEYDHTQMCLRADNNSLDARIKAAETRHAYFKAIAATMTADRARQEVSYD